MLKMYVLPCILLHAAAGVRYRYHKVLTAPRSNNREGADEVVFDLSVFGHSALELQTLAPFGWNLHLARDTLVRVLEKPPKTNTEM